MISKGVGKIKKITKMIIIMAVLVLSFIIYYKKNKDFSEDDKFKTWIDINKTEFYDNEDINIQLSMHYIGDSEEIDVYIPKYPFSLLITGSNGFRSVLEPPNTFGAQIHTFKRDEIITMDCSSYGYYNYFQAMKIFKDYDQRESSIGMSDVLRSHPAELRLPPGYYTLTLTTWYEDDLSGESKHELYATKKIKVKAKNNRKSIHETRSTKNFKLEANLDKNIYEVDEYVNIWSSMTYCGKEDSIFYPDIDGYPMYINIYDENHDKLQLERVIYDLAFDYWFYEQGLKKDKAFYYKPFDTFNLPAGKYLAEFIYRYPNDDGNIVSDTIEINFEVVPSL
ncbi:hypothetical protein [Clostridium sp. Marseille-P299]|uniref:hypothetical protein n=1 Tax=Clostridium sp. Marseille-P299 TaxID=1805477 RepID=UPI000AD52742|nr:hypothetical protein [Clostridium sp. Marseille-P299]